MEPLVTIGLPVYNGEKSLQRCIDSILSQTFKDFVLIISDNSSTDSTSSICDKYVKSEKRISYFKQKENIGSIKNFHFVLNMSKTKYFVWIAHDDFWEKTFLEKNVMALNSKQDVIGSIGQTKYIGNYIQKFDFNSNDNILQKIYKKIRRHFLSLKCYNIDASTYEKRIKSCLKSPKFSLMFYSLFRTEILKKSIDHQSQGYDAILILKLLRYGNIHVFDDVLIHRGMGGLSSRNNVIDVFLRQDIKFHQILFPRIPYLKWCRKNLGMKILFQNPRYFISIGATGPWGLILGLIKYYKFRQKKQDYYIEKSLT